MREPKERSWGDADAFRLKLRKALQGRKVGRVTIRLDRLLPDKKGDKVVAVLVRVDFVLGHIGYTTNHEFYPDKWLWWQLRGFDKVVKNHLPKS